MMWTDKYIPELKEIPHQREIDLIIQYLKEKIPVLLYGPTGVGKTTSIIKIAKDHNYELLEINASDKRNKSEIETLIGNATQQLSLFGGKKLILLDEIDGLSGTQDKGGIAALTKIISKTKAHIVMTCNEIENDKIKSLKKKCKIIEFKPNTTQEISLILKEIAKKENITFKDSEISSLARRSNGDIRGAIIDLQVNSTLENNLDLTDLSNRENKGEIINALTLIFKSKDFNTTSQSLTNIDLDPNECFLWIEYNLPKEYTKTEDIYQGIKKLSKADIFKSRIIRRQYFRFLIYQSILMTAGVALAKKEKYSLKPSYKKTSRLLKIWMANQRNHKKKLIAEKISIHTHCSINHAIKTYPHYKKFLVKKSIIKQLDLSDDEIEYLNK
ncbi:replication factor C large subunit [Candidatus Woesearchaeota archaeon]|nr:replication factor C large subunit [Candidatus Woesearchaeota archaeon]